MTDTARTALASQLAAALQAIENAVVACPPSLWGDRVGPHEFWYIVYHTAFWLDCYSSETVEGFTPPAPYTLGEMDPKGVYPDRVYSPQEMLAYLTHGRAKALAVIGAMNDESAARRWRYGTYDMTRFETFLVTLRHVQHHAAQLQLLLRQSGVEPPRWVRQWPPSEPRGNA